MKHTHAIIVGASSGMGRELVRQLAQSGVTVGAVARREDRLRSLESEFPGRVKAFVHDVHQTAEVPDLFARIAQEIGGCDLVIYASGVMPKVGPEEFDTAKDAEMIRVNDLGCVAWLNEAARRFHGTRRGSIVAIGSVAGDRGRCGQPVYNASKAFVETYTEALRNRLAKRGVKVVLIKPGPTATEMTEGLGLKGMMPVHDAASKILKVVDKTGNHYLKPIHWVIFGVIRNIPSWIFRKLKI